MELGEYFENFLRKRLFDKKKHYNTIRNYKRSVYEYFELLEITDVDTYLSKKTTIETYEKDLATYFMKISNKYAPTTLMSKVNGVKQFLVHTDKRFKQLEIWDTIGQRLRGADTVTDEQPLDK